MRISTWTRIGLAVGGVLVLVALLLVVGVQIVPGVGDGKGRVSTGFQSAAFLEFLSFLLTAAAIGPLTAFFVQWRADRKWLPARINAQARLGEALKQGLDNYLRLLRSAEEDKTGIAVGTLRKIYVGKTIRRFEDFLAAYDDEHAAFTVTMHVEGSRIRSKIFSIYRILKSHESYLLGRVSQRVILSDSTIEKIRSQLGPKHERLAHSIISRRFSIDNTLDDPVFFSFEVEEMKGADVYKFEPIDIQSIKTGWQNFVQDFRGSGTQTKLDSIESMSDEQQLRLYHLFVKKRVSRPYVVELLMPDGFEAA